MMTRTKWSLLLAALLLQACASNDALFSEYDEACDKPVVNGDLWEPAVYFDIDQAVLSQADKTRLDVNIKILLDNPRHKISLQGFTDLSGGLNHNHELSRKRNQTVRQYLAANGVDSSRVKSVSYGGTEKTDYDNTTQAVRILERRVEMMLLDPDGQPIPFMYNKSSQLDSSQGSLSTESVE